MRGYEKKLIKRKNKAIVDTGILISAFAFCGIPKSAVKRVFFEMEIYVSLQLLKEYRDVPLELMAENKINHTQLKALISGIAAFVSKVKVVIPKRKLLICRDVKDNMLLECCLAAKVDFLITGDKYLLDIDTSKFPMELAELKIVTPRKFLELNNELGE